MREIKTLRDDGFSLLDQDSELAGTALLSLKLALKAFFSTYQSIRDKLPFYAAENRVSDFEDSILSSSPAYCEACVETIVHFQHFVELVCKDSLRADHVLLANDASRRHVILHKLLHAEPVTDLDIQELRSLEFKEALDRLCELIKEKKILDEDKIPAYDKLDFIRQEKDLLEALT